MKNYKQQLQYLQQKPIEFLNSNKYFLNVTNTKQQFKFQSKQNQIRLAQLKYNCNCLDYLLNVPMKLESTITDDIRSSIEENKGFRINELCLHSSGCKHCCFDGDNAQHALCLTRVVQFLSQEILEQNALFLFRKFQLIIESTKWKMEILEGMAAIIQSVEEYSEYENTFYPSIFADEVIPHLQQFLSNQQWQAKKMALDILYSLVVLQQDKILDNSYFKELMFELESNKIKQVRDSANLILDVLQSNTQIQSNNSQQQSSQ